MHKRKGIFMKNLISGVFAAALLCASPVAMAGVATPPPAAGEAAGRQAEPAPVDPTQGEANDYAAREAAAGDLAKFEGGGTAVYIGGGLLTVVLVVLLVVLIV